MATKTNKSDSLEKQVDAALEAGFIKLDGQGDAKKGRGRPRTKSASGEPPARQMLTPEEIKMENDKRVKSVINNATKRQKINQLKAFMSYFPKETEGCSQLSLEELTVDQLQQLLTCFEESVLGASEIINIPLAIKSFIGKVEDGAVTVGISNADHPYLGQLVKLKTLKQRIERDESLDKNIKLISVKMAGRLPRNPFINAIADIFRLATDSFVHNSIPSGLNDPKYSKLDK